MLNTVVLNADEFLLWIGKGRAAKPRRLSVHGTREAAARSFCALVLPDVSAATGAASPVVVVDRGKIRDFYAFVSTYVVEYVPFSAFFRVVTSEQLDILEISDGKADSRRAEVLTDALVGVSIAEAALYLQSRGSESDGKSVTLPAVNATYSAAILQALVRADSVDVVAIGKGWADMRSFVGGEPLPLSIDDLTHFWEIVGAAFSPNGMNARPDDAVLGRTLRQAASVGFIYEEMLSDLIAAIPELRELRLRFSGTREDRARAAQEAISILGNSPRGSGQIRDCVAGCLLSLVGDGSFKFLPSALSLTSTLRTAPIWFAVWAGIQKTNDSLVRFNCLGKRLARDLRAHGGTHAAPVDDISIDELRAGVLDMEAINRSQSGAISVEIYPYVSSRQRLPRHQLPETAGSPRLREELSELRLLINRSASILERMEGSISPEANRRVYRGSAKPRGVTRGK